MQKSQEILYYFFYIRIIILAKSEARTSMKSRKWDQFIIPSYKPFFFCICIVYKYIRPCGFNLFWWYGKKFLIRNKAIFIHINGCSMYVDIMRGVKILAWNSFIGQLFHPVGMEGIR